MDVRLLAPGVAPTIAKMELIKLLDNLITIEVEVSALLYTNPRRPSAGKLTLQILH